METSVFLTDLMPIRPYEKDDRVHIRVSYERDLDKVNIERTAYGILDMLGDVGGVTEAFFAIGTFIISIVQYQVFDNYLVSHLYKEQKPVTKQDLKTQKIKPNEIELDDLKHQYASEIACIAIKNRTKLNQNKIQPIRELLFGKFSSLLCCP